MVKCFAVKQGNLRFGSVPPADDRLSAVKKGICEMSFEFVRKLPTPAEIKEELPLPKELAQIKAERDAEIKDVLTGKSNKFLVIIGPCSADNEDSVCDYVNRLAKVNEKV